MDETEVMFIDDERNARDHRTDNRSAGTAPVPFRPRTGRVVVRSPGRAPVVIREPATVAEPEPRRVLGNLTTAELVEVGAQIVATLQPLPAAPVTTGRVETDVENLTLYQAALAVHAKRDEQLRTIGSLVGKLLS